MCTHREQEESWDSPKSLQNKPMAQRLARSYFILFVILFSSHQNLSIGWQVVSRQFHLGCLSSQRMSLSLIPPFSFFTLHYTPHSETVTAAKKSGEKKITASHRLVPAVLMIRWSGLWFISYLQLSSLSLTCTLFSPLTWFNTPKSHSKADAHCTRVCSPPTDGLTDHYNKHLLWSSLIKKKCLNRKYCTAGYE